MREQLSREELLLLASDEEAWRKHYDSLPEEEKQALAKMLAGAPNVGPQPGPQTEAFNSEADVLGYGGAAGGGKLTLVSNGVIKAPRGDIKAGEIKVGDKICDAQGGVQKVIATREWKDWDIWRICFSDGTSVGTSPEHLWLAWRSHVGTKKRTAETADSCGRVHGPAAARIFETQGLLKEMERGRRYRIPLPEPAIGNFNRYKIDPYLLGALLGDGYMPNRGGCRLTNHPLDIEIPERINSVLDIPMKPRIMEGKSAWDWPLDTKSVEHARLRDMQMIGKRAWEKELPKSACFAPIEWRWALLQGLMDTDGWAEPERCAYYCTTSPMLRDGVAELARSLGCFVTICDKSPTYTWNEEKRQGRPAFVLRIKSATPGKLFHLTRKKEIAEKFEHQSLSKEIVDIQTGVGVGDGVCIQVDHPSGLYLTNDYTVTHNSALIAILAILSHHRTVIYRKDGKQMRGLVDDLIKFAGTNEGLNRGNGFFYLPDRAGHLIEWGGIGNPGEEQNWKGRAHDLLCIDEATEIPEKKFRYLMAWLRTPIPGQRCRAVLTFNPPGGPEDPSGGAGRWVVDYFAPWLDERHPNPAQFGELRWFGRNEDNEEVEFDGPQEYTVVLAGKEVTARARSRTFIKALVDDNAYMDENYKAALMEMEEPYRTMFLRGEFRSGISDHMRQAIPTQWIDDAMGRWRDAEREGRLEEFRAKPMSTVGVDVARGGMASTVISRRHDWFWDKLQRYPGTESKNGPVVAQWCVGAARDGATVCIDVLGIGSSPYDFLVQSKYNVAAVKGSQRRGLPVVDKSLPCYNMRSTLYRILRKVLDPSNGLEAMLPYDNLLRSELIAIKTKEGNTSGTWQLEPKERMIADLGFSPDNADAVANTLFELHEEPGLQRILYTGAKKADLGKLRRVNPIGRGGWMST